MSQPLPLFSNMLDPFIDRIFAPLCEDITVSQIVDLNKQIIDYLNSIKNALRSNEFLDLCLAEKIADTLTKILGDNSNLPEDKLKLVVGAARYFVRVQDAQGDFDSILGFDDDVTVLNYVLKEIGRDDLKVDL